MWHIHIAYTVVPREPFSPCINLRNANGRALDVRSLPSVPVPEATNEPLVARISDPRSTRRIHVRPRVGTVRRVRALVRRIRAGIGTWAIVIVTAATALSALALPFTLPFPTVVVRAAPLSLSASFAFTSFGSTFSFPLSLQDERNPTKRSDTCNHGCLHTD